MTGKLDAAASTSFTSHSSNAHFFRSTPGACSQAIKPQSICNSSRDYSLPDVQSTFKGKICPCTEKHYFVLEPDAEIVVSLVLSRGGAHFVHTA